MTKEGLESSLDKPKWSRRPLNAQIKAEMISYTIRRRLKRFLWLPIWIILLFSSWTTAKQQQSTTECSTATLSTTATDEEIIQEEYNSLIGEEDSVIVVATVDGRLAGLSRRTGKVLWKQQNNDVEGLSAPLVSTTTTTKSSGNDGKTVAVPSVDGRVFLTVKQDSATTTVRELVQRAPFVDSRGRFYVGSRHATAAALDRDSGQLLRLVSGDTKGKEDISSLDDHNVLWVGRVDYSVSLYDAQTGAMDVQFSSSEIMSVSEMLLSDKDKNNELSTRLDGLQQQQQQHAPRLMLPDRNNASNKESVLLATPNGNVAYRNSDTGQIEWISDVTFDTPVAFAVESATGNSLGVDIVPDAAVPSSSMKYLSRELERQMEAMSGTESSDQMIVSALKSGQLFAMPLGKLTKSSLSHAGISHPQSHSSTSSVSAIGSTKKKVPNIGRHLQDPISSHKQKHPLTVSKTNRKCAPFYPGFPACLVGTHSDEDFAGGSFLDNVQDYGALVLQHKLGLDHEEMMQQMKYQYRKKKRSFFRIMASWLPPTMALIFVLSFELGRRQRLKVKDVDSTTIVSSNQPLEEYGMRNVGVIAVSDEVLGFGGHGTVVYKGMLDGRRVAVKRMLKAYHASANREISLLIESDGHPNVVRYFLKEVRGDFVYLALELCDMSLHDLIGSLRNRSSVGTGISDSTKSILFQIVQGVRHLHSLRIVHRDLKPANILLAKSRNSKKNGKEAEIDSNILFDFFDQGLLTAKISDMGLGKQLAGQSSFGMSTLGGASLSGSINGVGESSRLVGAGPGSVGWQAPEVMSLRWTTDAGSVASGASSKAKHDNLIDASPLEVAMNARTSRSVDIFSLGCIFHSTLIPGAHPFGEWFEREANIMRNRPTLAQLEEVSPDAFDLVTSMIHRDPKSRPSAKQICDHPFFWSPQRRLAFLCELSDRIECDTQASQEGAIIPPFEDQTLIIERNAVAVVTTAWDTRLDPALINNVSKFRTYDPSSVRDCLRLIRNKHHHYDELPPDVKDRVGSNPDGLMTYFDSRFPRLVLHCYSVCRDFMTVDDPLVAHYSISISRRQLTKKTDSYSSNQDDDQAAVSTLIEECGMQLSKDTVHSIDKVPLSNPSVVQEVTGNPRDDGMSEDGTIAITPNFPAYCPNSLSVDPTGSLILWEGSSTTKSFNCRGWMRSRDEWIRRTDTNLRKRDANIKRCSEDPKFRSRLCNHWDVSFGTFCPMRKKSKCVFAHGPVELRVKEGKRHRWGKLVDKEGNNSNPCTSGGEDTYGVARSVESMRKEEGKWNTDKTPAKQRTKGNQTPDKKQLITSAES